MFQLTRSNACKEAMAAFNFHKGVGEMPKAKKKAKAKAKPKKKAKKTVKAKAKRKVRRKAKK
jgi:hypothetical protein